MIFAWLFITGLCIGSFINALVWRIHEQDEARFKILSLSSKKKGKVSRSKVQDLQSKIQNLSIAKGRSMCPHCKHQLAGSDLVPVLSWIELGGKCRYCRKPISWQYPIVELLTAVLFVVSYLYYPLNFDSRGVVLFVFWLVFLAAFIALAVYDIKWQLLPNRIIMPMVVLAGLQSVYLVATAGDKLHALIYIVTSVLIAGGLFYILFYIPDIFKTKELIGGGDVKLGLLLGLVLANPWHAVMTIFLSSLLGTLVAIPLMVSGKATRTSHIPYGPFLIAAAIIAELAGGYLTSVYNGYVSI